MAYISTAKVAEIRANLKKEFPEIKFSVKKSHYTSIDVTILKSPYDFRPDVWKDDTSISVNYYWLEQHGYKHIPILERIIAICNEGNHDNSDIMADYFDVGWYFHLNLGTWEKPFEVTHLKPSQQMKLLVETPTKLNQYQQQNLSTITV